jgi:hypothetical protein
MTKQFLKFPLYSLVMLIASFIWTLFFASCKKDEAAILPANAISVTKSASADSASSIGTTKAATPAKIKQSSPTPVFFDADLTGKGNLSAYAMVINPSRISVVNDPVYGSKRKVMFMDVRTGDTGGLTENPRAQVQTSMNYTEGQTVYVGLSVRFTENLWTYFLTFSELYGAPYVGTSPFRLGLQGSNIVASATSGGKQTNLWQEPMQTSIWYDFVYCEVLSHDPSKGTVQLWIRKQGESSFREILPATKIATITTANLLGPNYHKLACYYDKSNTFTDASRKTRVSEVKMYLGNHKVGGSFDQVAPAALK